MKTNIICIEGESDFHPSCIRLTEKAIEVINVLQVGGSILTKVHTDEDFSDCGIRSVFEEINSVSDFILATYSFKMSHLEGSDKDDFAYEVLKNMNRIQYIKMFFNSLRAKPEFDEFDRKPEAK